MATRNKKKRPVNRRKGFREPGQSSNPFIANEFKEQDTWRMFKIMSEFVEGFEALRDIRPGRRRRLRNSGKTAIGRKRRYVRAPRAAKPEPSSCTESHI